MKSVTVIGLGWLGKACADDLYQQGYQVKGTKRSVTNIHSPFPIFEWSLSEKFPEELLSEIMIINIADKTQDISRYQELFQQLHTVKQLIFISTTAVYEGLLGNITEESIPITHSHALQKEEALRNSCENYLILRLAGLVGPNRNPAKFLAGKKSLKNRNQKVNLVHQQDVVNCIRLAIEKGTYGILNICSSMHPARYDFYTQVCAYHGLELPDFSGEEEEPIRWIDNSKSMELLNYKYLYDNLLSHYLSEKYY